MHLIRRNARSMPWAGEEAPMPIREQDSIGHDINPRTKKSSSPSEELGSRILRGYCGAKGFGKARPISYQAQGPCRGGRNVRGRTKKVQTARIYCRGQPCPRQAEITEGESVTPPRAVSSSIPKEIPSAVGQP